MNYICVTSPIGLRKITKWLALSVTVNWAIWSDSVAEFSLAIDLNQNVSLSAINASVIDILREIEQASGVSVTFISFPNDRISIDVQTTPLERVLPKLAPGHLAVYKADKQSVSTKLIKEVIIVDAGPAGSQSGSFDPNLPTGEPVAEVNVESTTGHQETVQTESVNENTESDVQAPSNQ